VDEGSAMTAADALRRLLADVREARTAYDPERALTLNYIERLALDGLAGEAEPASTGWTSKLWHKSAGWWTCAACNYGNVNDARECWNCRRPLHAGPKIANGDDGDFFCPKCDAFTQWGTSGCTGPKETWVGHCYGEHGCGCGFSWPRTDDSKYFKAKPTEEGQSWRATRGSW